MSPNRNNAQDFCPIIRHKNKYDYFLTILKPMLNYWHNMNTLTNDTNETQAAAQFAIGLSAQTVSDCMAVNNTLATTQKIRAFFGAHYAHAENGVSGLVELICFILQQREAVFPRNIEATELRPIAVAGALYTHEIVAAVEDAFASAGMRYKAQACANVLSIYGKKRIGKIHLTTVEDKDRLSTKCRKKYYLIQTAQ